MSARIPAWEGVAGKAWEFPLDPRTPAHYAAVYGALLYAPAAHPLWAYHLLNVTSLRDIVGVPKAKKHYPEAEYELSVFAINPDSKHDPEKPPYDLLVPYYVCEQFHCVPIDKERELCVISSRSSVDGHRSTD